MGAFFFGLPSLSVAFGSFVSMVTRHPRVANSSKSCALSGSSRTVRIALIAYSISAGVSAPPTIFVSPSDS